jgi:hypothetical protein
LETARILSQDPLEYDLFFRRPNGEPNRIVVSEKSYEGIKEGKDGFIATTDGKPVKIEHVFRTIHYHRAFYNMREILLAMVSCDCRKILEITKETAEYRGNDPLEKDLHRASLLLAMGFDPLWVLGLFEIKATETYMKHRSQILMAADFTPGVSALKEIQEVPDHEWKGIWKGPNLRTLISLLPTMEVYLRICALIYREDTPANLRESYRSSLKKYKAGEKSSILQKLTEAKKAPTPGAAHSALDKELKLLFEESLIAALFYLEHRDEILKSHNVSK